MNKSFRGSLAARTLTAALAFLAAAGCVDQAKEVAKYQKQLNALPGVASMPVPASYTPLTLQEAMRLAEQYNESLGLSGETYLQALITRDREFSTFLPQISIGPNLSEQQPVRGNSGPVHNFSVPLNLNQNLFNGFRDEAQIEADTATVEQQRQLLLNEQQAILIDVVTAYYAVLTNERSVAVYTSSLAEQDERVRQARAQYRLQMGTPLAVAQSESQASSTRVQLIQAKASVVTARAALQFIIGSPAMDRPLTDGFQTPPQSNRPVEAWLVDADSTRQDLKATVAAVVAARQQVRVAMGEYLPSVTLDMSYFIYKESQPLNEKLSGALSANIPIFTGGQIEADVRTALSQLRAALLTQSQTRRQVEDDIRTAYVNLQSSRDQITELRVELDATRRALEQAQGQYTVGTATNLDVLTAVDALLSTQLQLATQEYQEKIAYMTLLQKVGVLNLAVAVPTMQPTTAPADLREITTPDVVRRTTRPAQ